MVHSPFPYVRLIQSYYGLQGTGITLGGLENPGFNRNLVQVSMEVFMSKLFQSMAVLVLALAGLVGCIGESHAAEEANPARIAEMKQTYRDLWLGHI